MISSLNRAGDWASVVVQPWIVLALIVFAGGIFLARLIPKARTLLLARPVRLATPFGQRLCQLLLMGLGQKKLFKESGAGWMHALIFWGFWALLLRATYFFVIGLFPAWDVSGRLEKGLINGLLLFKDGATLLVMSAALFALYRRLVLKPYRLTLSSEGNLILFLILAIMASDILFDAGWFARMPEEATAWSPLAFMLSPLLGTTWAPALAHNLGYWVHICSILYFLTLLPQSKHFHIITSLPNLFLSDLPSGVNRIHRIDFEDETKESFGVSSLSDFTWKSMLDFYSCTECGRCDRVCPALAADKPLSPKQLTVDLRDFLNQESPYLLKPEGGEGRVAKALLGQVIDDETLWSCTTCGACEEECPVAIEYIPKIIEMRQGLVLNEDRYPAELTQAFKSLETNSNPWGLGRDSRGDWAKGLDVKLWDKENPTEYLYFVGCNGSFDQRGQKIARSIASLLNEAGVDYSILGKDEGCTGDPARRAGNEYLFDMLASQNAETFQQLAVRKVITHCPHCFNSLKNEYPEFGAHLEVVHHSELLNDLIRDGLIERSPDTAGEPSKTVYHDSCYLGRHNDDYESSRSTLKATGNNFSEAENNRERGACCGAGGARFLLEDKVGKSMSHNRLDELMKNDPQTIAVSCPFCVLMLEDAVKSKGLSEKVRVADISELARERMGLKNPAQEQR
ncbi:MAG: 4Fe-4S dicluster domain-containing protein [Candidatus Nitrohelix vancouverensis]|uniref:4Fe-4S dicluster domain-containing protein n=1 Tax=Candidatus Nitrohelix vancouverensis TaxID=2705534 RepID=A0A7T0G4I2_9BACT|nr:MAG: 4Fe-4S dicluster domain-containing protein [Candidatus Nitrohelix vancouverensis]